MTKIDALVVLKEIGEPGAYSGVPEYWDEALAAIPGTVPVYLDESSLPGRVRASGLGPEFQEPLVRMLRRIASDDHLKYFAWYMHWRVFVSPGKGIPWGAPPLIGLLGGDAGLFYLLLSLEFPGRLAAWHRKLGYPSVVTDETIQQIPSYVANHLKGRGVVGLFENQFPWFSAYLTHPYVRLGRFEYQLHPYAGGASVWRRGSDGAVIALAEDGCRILETGLLLGRDAPAPGSRLMDRDT